MQLTLPDNLKVVTFPGQIEDTLGYRAGMQVAPTLRRTGIFPKMVGFADYMRRHPFKTALLSAAVGGGIGALTGKLTNNDPVTSGMMGAAIGGIGTGLAGKLMESNYNKSASFINGMSGMRSNLQNAVAGDSSLDFSSKASIMSAIDRLDPSQITELLQLIRTAGGAGIGAIIARYLMHTGLLGTILGSIAVGLFGSGAFGGQRTAI